GSVRTRTPRFGTNETRPSAARRRNASRTGVRETLNCSDNCSWRRTVPGASSPETIASSITRAMSSALVVSRLTPEIVRQPRLRGELRLLGRALEREGRRVGRHRLRDEVEVAGADFALVARRRVPELLEGELVLLKLDVRRHRAGRVAVRKLEHGGVQRVEAGEGDELEPVAPVVERLLEAGDRVVVQMLAP